LKGKMYKISEFWVKIIFTNLFALYQVLR